MHELLRAWSGFEPSPGAKILAGDETLLEPTFAKRRVLHDSWASFNSQPEFGGLDKRLHLSLIPQPFFGAISEAGVIILTLNPSLHAIDYYSEFFIAEYHSALAGTRKQQLDPRFPNMWLDPRFSWHSGFSYWHGKMESQKGGSLITKFARQSGISRVEALSFFARSVAILQLLPYHSSSFDLPDSILNELRSVRLARSFASEVLVPAARSGEKLLIAVRKGNCWGLPACSNIVVYKGNEPRAAHLGPDSRGGKEILTHLAQVWAANKSVWSRKH